MTLPPPELALDVEHLGSAVRRLSQDVRGIEGRQVLLDRRLVELGSQIQGLQEEQYAQTYALERGQRAVAVGAKRALSTAVALQQQAEQEGEWNKCLEGLGLDADTESQVVAKQLGDGVAALERKFEEQQRWLSELGRRVEGGTSWHPSGAGSMEQRLASLEQAHTKLASGTRRALHTALVVHRKQEGHEQEEEFEKLFGDDKESLEQECSQRFSEQDERLDKILRIVDVLTDKVHDTGVSLEAVTRGQLALETGSKSNGLHSAAALSHDEELREKVDELEANLYGLAAQVQSQTEQQGKVATLSLLDHREEQQEQQQRQQQRTMETLTMALECIDARLERGLAESSQRLDLMQESQDEQQLTLRHLTQQLPEVSKRLEQLWAQCQHYFPRVQEQDVHFGFLRSSFEAHKQQMLELTEHLEGKGGSMRTSRRPSKEMPLMALGPTAANDDSAES